MTKSLDEMYADAKQEEHVGDFKGTHTARDARHHFYNMEQDEGTHSIIHKGKKITGTARQLRQHLFHHEQDIPESVQLLGGEETPRRYNKKAYSQHSESKGDREEILGRYGYKQKGPNRYQHKSGHTVSINPGGSWSHQHTPAGTSRPKVVTGFSNDGLEDHLEDMHSSQHQEDDNDEVEVAPSMASHLGGTLYQGHGSVEDRDASSPADFIEVGHVSAPVLMRPEPVATQHAERPKTRKIKMKHLQKGHVVINDFGHQRTLTSDAMKTHQGYYRAETDKHGQPVNLHGDSEVHIVDTDSK